MPFVMGSQQVLTKFVLQAVDIFLFQLVKSGGTEREKNDNHSCHFFTEKKPNVLVVKHFKQPSA